MKQERKQYISNTHHKEGATYIKNIAKQITKNSIKWDKILELIQSKEKVDKYTINRQNNAAKQCLSQDLKYLNIEINSADIYQQVISNTNISFNKARDLIKQRSYCVYVNRKQMQEKIKRLQYFNGPELLYYKHQVYQIDDSMISLYCQDKQILEPIDKSINTSFLTKYLSGSTKEITEVLNTHNIRSFLLQELKQKGKINLLLKSIKQIVQKLAVSLDKQTIQAIYSEVNRQIAAFNNDINQVSCQISLIFNGYCHLYAIYSTWKKLALETERIKRAPLNQLIKDKQRQKQNFLNMTSGNQQRICETECDKIMDQALVHIKKVVQDYKTPHIENAITRYSNQNTRQNIQKKIDIQTFRQQTSPEQILKYLQDPKSVIEKKYQSQINNSLNSLDAEFKMNPLVKEIYTQISQCIEQMQTLLRSKELSIKKQQASFSDFFSIVTHGKQQIRVGDPIFQEKAKRVFLNYILDLFIKENQQKYIQDSFIAQPNKKPIVFNRTPKPCLQNLIGILKKTDTGITNLVIFVEKIKEKLHRMRNQIYQTTQINQKDKQDFRKRVRVNVCHAKCPGCQRLCGEEGSHAYHACKYGHQMRALGNVKLQNGEASVIRCQDLQPFNMINFNGNDMSWTQFKAYFENHQNVKWKFDDMVRGNRQELFDLAWNIVGKEYCTKKSMKWVASNQRTTQDQKKACFSKTHYIFALDQSGSMEGKPWEDAISALTEAVNSIINLNREQALRISIIKFASTSTIFQQNKKPSQVSFNIPFGDGGTSFSAPFKHAIQIASKCIQEFKIVFMFMSDGGASYPKQQIKTIQAMQLANPGRFQFNGLQFGQSNSNIQQMASDLQGTTSGAIYGGQQLAQAYKEIITRDIKLN